MRRLLLLVSAVVFVDTLFFSALAPLLPHYAHTLGLGKAGAGLLAASYPAGTFLGAIPSGIVAARLGVKPTVLIGLIFVGICTVAFGLVTEPWQLDLTRFLQGLASSFSWTGSLAWIVAASPPDRRGRLIGSAIAVAVGGSLLGPALGGVASVAGVRWTFGVVGVLSFVLVAWAATTRAEAPEEPQPLAALGRAVRDREIVTAGWLVLLAALLFGTLAVLAPLRLSALGYGSIAIGAVFVCSGAFEAVENVFIGRLSDRVSAVPVLAAGLLVSIVAAVVLPWPSHALVLAVLVVVATVAFGTLFTPSMTLFTQLAESSGLDHGYTFALINLVWAPGQTFGAVGAGEIGHAAGDTAVYFVLAALCAVTFLWLMRSRSRIAAAV